jgi:integrase
MPRKTRAPKLETRTARLKLAVRRKPHFVSIGPGISIGYRRNTGAGSWVARVADGRGGNWTKAIATADDHEEANGASVLTFWAAADKARALARAGEGTGERPATVGEALDAYEASLRARGGDLRNVTRVRHNLPSSLGAKPVGLLTAKELRSWRDHLVAKSGLKPASADRTARQLKAALTLAAQDDPRITNAATWRAGLPRLPDSDEARNTILSDDVVRAAIAAAYEVADAAYGLLIEVAAETGARRSQLLRLEVQDLQDGGAAPRLLMPASRKGRRRKIERRPLPIPMALAAKLRQAAVGRPDNAPLLVQSDGSPWPPNDLTFPRVAAAAALAPGTTAYALRHSSIVRQLLAGIPTRVVAAGHDTSVPMIEAHYSRFIVGDASDTLVRRTLLDMAAPSAVANVVPLGRKS